MLHTNYHLIYDSGFFERSDGKAHWDKGRLKVGDDLAAIAYALGIPSFERMREIVVFTGDGRDPDCTNIDREHVVIFMPGHLSAMNQMRILRAHQTRYPKSVLDVGGGRGEVSAAFAWLGIPVQEIEPHKDALIWVKATAQKFFDGDATINATSPLSFQAVRKFTYALINTPIPECLPEIDFEDLDTVLFCESLEHIPEDCFTPFWDKVGAVLRDNHGMLVVTNWIDYHPLNVSSPEHCRRVDDALYAELAVGGTVTYQRGSHLVVQY